MLLYAPLLVFRLQDTTAIGLSITPTKALGRDQERSARSKGIPAIAIDEATASHASHNEHRDLVKEVMGGKYGLVIVLPEMLTSERLKPLLADPKFRDRLCIVFVDECYLVEEQGADFRPCYKEIGRLRHRLPSSVPWVAVSATLPVGKTFDRVMASLGFNPGCYIHTHLPIDNPHVCYIPRFFQYPISSNTFLDISWLIPSAATSATDITKSLIFCNTINLGTRVYSFLKRLLPQSLSPKEIILPYHSLISDQGRLRAMERFRTGTTRIIVASDCFTWGVDVSDIRQVIVFDVPSSFLKLVQQMGRAGRDKKPATAITYASRWVRDIVEDSKGLKGQKAADLKRWESMCQLLRTWFNPPEDSCPHDVFCRCFGDDLFHPPNCCIKHSNVLPDLEPEPSRVEAFTAKHPKDPVLRSDRTHAPFTGLLQEAASDMISAWT
ncbi:P-loop containing nucleoside triphosphate hydrolase protein [Thelephora terrestris]|uniref:DNA 3'-5' helicase n=1 Tax=Thelephora terrestris TaxID=56493 RepID=A0A9P6LB68_9AGAM|nr:P-loop containing nucleoside triphosphate hydrolase protein [Thelephora terrestris]